MSEVETVALWVSIFTGAAGIVLAVVAIWFARSVDDRAKRVSDQTIKSLQKIETTVEGLSKDTTSLIKAAWDKMLGQVGPPLPDTDPTDSVENMLSGISAELQAKLLEEGEATPGEVDRIQSALEDMKAPLAAQIASQAHSGHTGDMIEHVLESLQTLSPDAQELARRLTKKHLTREQYRQLEDSDLGGPLEELRQEGLIVPLRGKSDARGTIPVYYFPPRISNVLSAALQLLPEIPPPVAKSVFERLNDAGYFGDMYSQDD